MSRSGFAATVVPILFCGVVLTGCLRSEIGVEIDGDGAGRAQFDLYVPRDRIAERGISDVAVNHVVEALNDAAERTSTGVEVSSAATDDERGMRIVIPFDDYRQVSTALTGRDPNAPGFRLFGNFEIRRTAERGWSFRGIIAPGGVDDVVASINRTLAGQGIAIPDRALTTADVQIAFALTLPGEIATTDSHDVEGNRARWNITGQHAVTEMSIRTRPAPFPFRTLTIGTSAVVVVIALVAVWVGRRRRTPPPDAWSPPSTGDPSAGGWGPGVGSANPPMSPPPYRPAGVWAPDHEDHLT